MTAMYSPYASRVMSDWPYRFPVPDPRLSRRDLRSLKVSARRERPRLLMLRAGELTPALRGLQASVHQGQNAVFEKAVEYADVIQDRLDAAQAVLDAAPPQVQPPPDDVPVDGIAYQTFVDRLRRSQASAEAAKRHDEAVASAQLVLRKGSKDLQVVALLTTRAFDEWTLFGHQLFEWHYDFAFGTSRMDPDLARPSFSPMQLSDTLDVPALHSAPRASAPAALEQRAEEHPDADPHNPEE